MVTIPAIRIPALAVGGAVGLLASVLAAPDPAAERFWPQWRGPDATGTSKRADPPVEWSETKNIRWKVEIPGRGSATPVIWDDRLFVLTAVPNEVSGDRSHAPRGGDEPRAVHRFTVLALDRSTGRVVWERVAKEEAPHEGAHQDHGTWASSSAVTDGERVFASFESRGLYAYDMEGTLLWQKDLGDKKMRNQFGEGSTPALYDDRLVIVWDHQGDSFIVALDALTGKEIWRAARDEIDSWATPLIVEHEGRAQVVTSAMNRVRSYDLETGELVWESEGVTMNPIPSPVAADGMVFVTSGFRGSNLKAIRLAKAHDDITGSDALVWTLDRDTPYIPSPLLYENILYLLKSNSGILSAFDARTGKPHYQLQRLEDAPEVFASPVGASGRVYIPGKDGKTVVIRHGPTYEVLATNTLDDSFDASPALVDKEIFLRGHRYLYCIASS
ncbi:MAG: PQQ-binding-like beta-propeller repeat protein [Luteitalea sp.]|nr:PQQ-binding-like beta-propeller repeat protein [Luteitalea sp.]